MCLSVFCSFAGDCIELFDSKFVQDIVTRYSANYDGDGGANETTHRLIDYNGLFQGLSLLLLCHSNDIFTKK